MTNYNPYHNDKGESIMIIIVVIMAFIAFCIIKRIKYNKLESDVLQELGFPNWNVVSCIDKNVTVKSRQSLEKYDDIKFFKTTVNFLKRKTLLKENTTSLALVIL